jgi:hypothetical protein
VFVRILWPQSALSQDKPLIGQDCYVSELSVPYVRVYASPDPYTGTPKEAPIGYLAPRSRFHVLDQNDCSRAKGFWIKISASDGREGWISRAHNICPAYESKNAWARASRVRSEDAFGAPAGQGPVFILATSLNTSMEGFLRAEARILSRSKTDKGESGPSSKPLTRDEQKAWRKCVAYYEDAPELTTDNFWIPEAKGEDLGYFEAIQKYVPDGSKRVDILFQAEPIYRKHWWIEHRAEDLAWIGNITPWLDRVSNSIAKQIARAFDLQWPERPINVVVRGHYGPRSVFLTDSEYVLVALSSDPQCRGFSAIELLFREAIRRWAGEIDTKVKKAAQRRGREAPKDFVDMLLSYTAGELTRVALEKEGVRAYHPLILDDSSTATIKVVRVLDKYWRVHLDGVGSYESALNAVLTEME